MFHGLFRAALALALSLPAASAAAQSNLDAFRAALAAVPASVVAPPPGAVVEIEFGDPRAVVPVMALQGLYGRPLPLPLDAAAVARVVPLDMTRAALVRDPEAMVQSIGLRVEEIGPILSVTAHPERVALLSIAPGAAARMVATLGDNGHFVERRGAVTILSRGADFETDLDWIDLDNPFGGHLGLATRFAVAEGMLAYASATAAIETLIAGRGPSLAEAPEIAAMLSGLEAAAEGAGALASAYVILGEEVPDMLVADFANGAEETGIMVFPAADTASAEALANRLTRNWHAADRILPPRRYAEAMQGPIDIRAHAGTPAAVTLRRTRARDFNLLFFENAVAGLFLQMLVFDDIAPLLAP